MSSIRKTLDKILNSVEEAELKSVVKKYAKSNRDFLFFLQLNFLHLLPTDEPVKKYGALLSSSFRLWLDRPDKINISATKKIKQYFEELRQQCLDMISLKNYIEAYGIIKNLLLYNSLFIEKTWPESPEELMTIHQEVLKTYHKLAEQNLARPLKEEMIQDLQSLLITGSVKIFDTQNNAIFLLTEIIDSKGKLETFYNNFYEHLLHQPPKSTLTNTAVKTFLISTGIHSSKNWANKLYSSNLIKGGQIYEQCESWLLDKKFGASALLAEQAIHFVSGRSRGAFFEILCRTKIADGKIKQAIDDLLAFVSDPYTTAPMIEKALKSFPNEFQSAAKKKLSAASITTKLESKKEKLVLAHLLAWLDYSDELLNLAEEHNSAYILMPFNKVLYHKNPKQLKGFYIRYIDEYLENHIGKMSIHYISKLLDDIKNSGVKELSGQLSRHIASKFSHRQSVINL